MNIGAIFFRNGHDRALGVGQRGFFFVAEALAVGGFELGQLFAKGGHAGVDGLLGLGECGRLGFGGDGPFRKLGGGEERLEAVVIGRRNGVELVVVATGAAHGEAEEDGADGSGDLGQLGLTFDVGLNVTADDLAGAAAAEAGGDERRRDRPVSTRRRQAGVARTGRKACRS